MTKCEQQQKSVFKERYTFSPLFAPSCKKKLWFQMFKRGQKLRDQKNHHTKWNKLLAVSDVTNPRDIPVRYKASYDIIKGGLQQQ